MRKAIIILFTILPIGTFSQPYPLDSFNVHLSVDFEDNTIGLYYNHDNEFEDDWGIPFDDPDLETSEIEQKGPTKVLRINFPKGTYDGNGQGIDFNVRVFNADEDTIIDVYLSYDVMWRPGFDFVISGKTGGHMIVGRDWAGEHSGGPYFWEGGRWGLSWFNAEWLGTGFQAFYFYDHDWESPWGHSRPWSSIHDDNGFCFYYTDNEYWHNITIRMVTNSVSDSGNYDGFAEGFLDGQFVTIWDSVRMRNVDTIGISILNVYAQFGGGTPEFAATRDEWLLLDNFHIWSPKFIVKSIPHNYEKSDSSRVLHIPASWTNAPIQYSDTVPIISNLKGQTINEGQSFSSIPLDNFVHDGDHDDNELSWYIYDTVDIEASITNRVATLTYPEGWNGYEVLKFKVVDPNDNADSVYITFRVEKVSEGTYGIVRQKILINLACDPEDVPSNIVNGEFCNHFTFDEQVSDSTFDLYNTRGDNFGFDFNLLTSGDEVSTNVYGYRGTYLPDTCEYTYWLVANDTCSIKLSGFKNMHYRLRTYSSYLGDGGTTYVEFLDTMKNITVQECTDTLEWNWLAINDNYTLHFTGISGYGFLNFIEITEFDIPIGCFYHGRNGKKYLPGRPIKGKIYATKRE